MTQLVSTQKINDGRRNVPENIYNYVVSILSADGLVPIEFSWIFYLFVSEKFKLGETVVPAPRASSSISKYPHC